jgi:hypothetical protein
MIWPEIFTSTIKFVRNTQNDIDNIDILCLYLLQDGQDYRIFTKIRFR